MSPTQYEELLSYVAPLIQKHSKRESITPDESLSVTLRYLVTSDAFATIGLNYRMSGTTVGIIVKETCGVIWDVLIKNNFLKVPITEDEWRDVAQVYNDNWNFPNCVGAIDRKLNEAQCTSTTRSFTALSS